MLSRSRSFDYVTVGHVTVDVIAADASRRPGGGAFYSALQAARLGLRALILTQGSPPEIEALLAPYRDELELRILQAPATTTFATSWPSGQRRQRVLAWAGPIAGPIEVDTQILHFAPVARETPATWRGHADFVGLTPQGLARTWDPHAGETRHADAHDGAIGGEEAGGAGETGTAEMADNAGEAGGELRSAPLPSDRDALDALLPHLCNAIVISKQERAACAPLLAAATATGAVLAVTAGPGATSVQLPGDEITQVQAPAVSEPRDDLGAGDVFAAAFFVALHEGLSPAQAAAFGNAAAAIRIEGVDADAIGDRRAIEARLP
ncbi:MAG TPA: PfkB family carbohydrate kinase [Solirubrobacteraceae bacterium]